ncbi:protein-methionine-sulfoxide reductase heme-binding subunit MsrQ [Elioraea thermophila]|uniref:sulfite oxidase heme-binding subunit YedZ n=1 Tax=Elioraea thermophila TaxID=2185104 RepID=UPI0013004513|nr:ferric reductase-like transmembrane domain-containing protein [Elioraea thermophila]
MVALLSLGLALPALALGLDALRHGLGPDPWAEASRRSGSWALVFLLASLAVTPARQTLRLPALAPLRRVIGLTAFAYAVLHLGVHLGSIGGDVPRLLAEMVSQRNLLFGAVAIALLIPLAATSFDRAIRALGGVAWRRLHRLVFPAAALAIVHFAVSWPQKVDVTEPAVAAGLFAWLVGYRLVAPRGGAPGPAAYAGLAVAAGGVTAALEFAWFALRTQVDPWLVLAANLDPELAPRPAAWVLAAGLGALALRLVGRSARSSRHGSPSRRVPAA